MENNTIQNPDPYFGEDISSIEKKTPTFDFILWFYRILKYWYLFIISLVICLGYAYIKNRSWVPEYTTKALMVLENRGGIGVANAVSLGSLVQNPINQQMILKSYDMVVRTVENLPQMQVLYFKDNKFNQENLYGRTPIQIECQSIAPLAYSKIYTIAPIDSERCKIYIEELDSEKKKTKPEIYSAEARYGEFLQEPEFYIRVVKTDRFVPNFAPFNFRFVSKSELIGRYSGKVYTAIEEEGSTALTILKNGTNPEEDKDFLTALLAEYQKYNLLLKNEAADRSISFLQRQLSIVKDSLRVSENTFKDYQNETGLYQVESIDVRNLKNQNSKSLAELNINKRTLLIVTETIKKQTDNNEMLSDPATYGLSNTMITEKIAQYNQLLGTTERMGVSHPMYISQKNKLAEAKVQVLSALRTTIENLQIENDKLIQDSLKIETEMNTLPTQTRTFLRYEGQYKINEQYDTYLTQKIREANLQKASNIPDNYILEAPRLVSGPINAEEKRQNYIFYLLLGLAIPLIFVVCKEELFNNSIATKEDCERIAGFPVVGTVENVAKKQAKGRVIVKNFPKSSFAESFRNMRIRIEYMAQKESKIVTLVTSAEPADGKTFIAANIASVYQLTGRKVVLVDFDLRRPSVAKLLDINSKRGVSNFLIGQVSLNDILTTHPEYGFDVIPAGTLPPNPSELIKTKKTKDLIDYLHSKYDYVVIDCSPVGLVSDAYILAKMVDTTLFVIRRAKTNKSFFKSVIAQVRNDGITNVGLIFNDVKGREGYYGTSRYYGDKSYYMKRNSYYHDDYFEK